MSSGAGVNALQRLVEQLKLEAGVERIKVRRAAAPFARGDWPPGRRRRGRVRSRWPPRRRAGAAERVELERGGRRAAGGCEDGVLGPDSPHGLGGVGAPAGPAETQAPGRGGPRKQAGPAGPAARRLPREGGRAECPGRFRFRGALGLGVGGAGRTRGDRSAGNALAAGPLRVREGGVEMRRRPNGRAWR